MKGSNSSADGCQGCLGCMPWKVAGILIQIKG
jgi:hypothetical protein